jgi:hypothetical protein
MSSLYAKNGVITQRSMDNPLTQTRADREAILQLRETTLGERRRSRW